MNYLQIYRSYSSTTINLKLLSELIYKITLLSFSLSTFFYSVKCKMAHWWHLYRFEMVIWYIIQVIYSDAFFRGLNLMRRIPIITNGNSIFLIFCIEGNNISFPRNILNDATLWLNLYGIITWEPSITFFLVLWSSRRIFEMILYLCFLSFVAKTAFRPFKMNGFRCNSPVYTCDHIF